MNTILRNELLKTYLKWRTYIGFIAIAVLVPLVEIALKLEGGGMVRRMTRDLSQDFFFVGNLFNGYFVTYFIMNSLWVHVPFLIALVAGDQLAGEATGGTFRLMLIRPASRTKILLMKYVATLFYAFSLVLFLAVVSLSLGLYLFGGGDLLVAGKVLTILPQTQLPLRMLIAFGLATWSMWCVASLAYLFSSLVENAIGPIVGTMTVIIVFFILSNIQIEFFESIKPYLFTTYFNIWQMAFEDPIPWQTIAQHGGVLGGFIIGFYAVTWYIFVKKDVLS
ncbi:MAG: ABC transporter permease subunit [Bacteroidetes bacterium]|nr:ABC transporter permease subunit [Bacteroidota bacterium]MCW5896590.1 ABC transporter permease subunit [Bacteroidota bacterium]